MTHLFVAPHPDDVAPSCGGLIPGLRELGQQPIADAVPAFHRRIAGLGRVPGYAEQRWASTRP
jgi:hypothetical protein